jgi:hypothetical protein
LKAALLRDSGTGEKHDSQLETLRFLGSLCDEKEQYANYTPYWGSEKRP